MAFLSLFFVTLSSAQTSLATLRGKVTDQQGGVLPGVTVTARQTETNTTRSGATNEAGQFYLPSLPAGTYELTVELSGFSTGKRTVILRVGQEAAADFMLTVGAVAETVLVSGLSPLVETSSTLGSVIDKKEIDNLPTIDRNFAGLAQLTPGVSSSGGGSMGFGAAGQRRSATSVTAANPAMSTASSPVVRPVLGPGRPRLLGRYESVGRPARARDAQGRGLRHLRHEREQWPVRGRRRQRLVRRSDGGHPGARLRHRSGRRQRVPARRLQRREERHAARSPTDPDP